MTPPRHFPHTANMTNNLTGMASSGSSGVDSGVASLTSASTLDSKLDLSPTEGSVPGGLLRDSGALFDVTDLESPEDMQRKDPLGTQIWKLYSKTKNQLPNAERMENLTWRMMSMNLRRQHQK